MSVNFFLVGASFLTGIFLALKFYFLTLILGILITKVLILKKTHSIIILVLILMFILGYIRVNEQDLKIQFPQKATIISPAISFGYLDYFYTNKQTIIFVSKNSNISLGDRIILEKPLPLVDDFFNKKGFKYYIIYNDFPYTESTKFLRLIFNLKNQLQQYLDKYLSFISSQIIKGIFLGFNPDKDIKDKFQKTGLLHILVVSGQNLTLMTSILIKYLKNFLNRRVILILGLIFSLIFSLTIFELATWRAFLMTSFILIFLLLGRPVLWRNVILITLIIFALIDPYFFFNDLSFQLSMLAILGIFYFAPVLKNFFNFPTIVNEILSVQIFLLPFLLYSFGYFSPLFLLSNLIVLPIFPLIFVLILFFLPFIWLWPVRILAEGLFLSFYQVVNLLANLTPGFNFYLPSIFVYLIYGYYIWLILKDKSIIDFQFKI